MNKAFQIVFVSSCKLGIFALRSVLKLNKIYMLYEILNRPFLFPRNTIRTLSYCHWSTTDKLIIDFSHSNCKAWNILNNLNGQLTLFACAPPLPSSSITTQSVKNRMHEKMDCKSTRLATKEIFALSRVETPEGENTLRDLPRPLTTNTGEVIKRSVIYVRQRRFLFHKLLN